MNELTITKRTAEWQKGKTLVLDSVSSPVTRRVYSMALDEFLRGTMPGRATASRRRRCALAGFPWRLGSSSIIVRMSAIRTLAVEAMDNGLLAPELAAGIQGVKSAKSIGVRMGNWLSKKQARRR